MAVVLPAPSGPTSPTISPARTCRLSPSTARNVPKVLTRFSVSSNTSFDLLFCKYHIGGHAELKLAIRVTDFQFHRIDGGTASLDSLDIARREFSLICDKRDLGCKGFIREGIHGDGCSLSQ